MATSDKLNKLLETKAAIKQAIIDKGVDIEEGTKFADYPAKISAIQTGSNGPDYTAVYLAQTSNGTNYKQLFYNCTLTEINLNGYDTSNVTDMSSMFYGCKQLTSLDLSGFDTSNVTNMRAMFSGCSSLQKVTLSQTLTTISSGMFKNCNKLENRGVYLTWVEEVGRGEGLGKFYQKIMISKISSPWQLEGKSGVVTTPTQRWEFRGSSKTHPRVVEGGTAVYGDHGEIYLTYSGSGYWSDYGIGLLTLRRKDGDYADPLNTASWVKYAKNPIFTAVGSENLRGAGHATFLKDERGKRFFCYHAYPFVDGKKVRIRNAYIEPYSIDYSAITPSSPEGVLQMGKMKNGVCATIDVRIKFKHR